MSPTLALIVVPTWNRLDSLKYWLDNIFNHTDTDGIKFIILNNGTLAANLLVESYMKKNNNLGIINFSENVGIPRSVNYAIKNFYKKEWMFSYFPDDNYIYTKNWFRIIYDFIKTTPNVGVVIRETTASSGQQSIDEIDCDFIGDNFSKRNNDVLGQINIFTPEAIASIGFLNEFFGPYGHEDYDWAARVFLSGLDLYSVNKKLIKCLHGCPLGNSKHREGSREMLEFSGIYSKDHMEKTGFILAKCVNVYRAAQELGMNLSIKYSGFCEDKVLNENVPFMSKII